MQPEMRATHHNPDLPASINREHLEDLVDTLADVWFLSDRAMAAFDACNLQPTSRATRLATRCAVIAILAHELGTEVNEPDEPMDELDLSEEQ